MLIINDFHEAVPRSINPHLRRSDHKDTVVKNIVIEAFKWIAAVFINILSLGFISLIWMHKNRERTRELKDEKKSLEEFQGEQIKKFDALSKKVSKIIKDADKLNQEKQKNENEKAHIENLIHQKSEAWKAHKKLHNILLETAEVESLIEKAIAEKESANELTWAIAYSKMYSPEDGIDPLFTGFVPSRYLKKPSDEIDIPGKFKDKDKPIFENGRFLKGVPTPQGNWVNDRITIDALLDSAFDWAQEELSLKNFQDSIIKSLEHEFAFYKYMVYLLIDAAGIISDCDGRPPRLELNNANLIVEPSNPYRTKKRDSEDFETLYKNYDGFTPRDSYRFPRGVDPLGVKWILIRHENKIEQLILKPFLDKENLEIDAELKIADCLIEEIAASLKDRYQALFQKKMFPIINFPKAWIAMQQTKSILKSRKYFPIEDFKELLSGEVHKLLNQIGKYFDMLHLNINDGYADYHGSLFSSLAILLFEGVQKKEEIDPMAIRKAMACYLEVNKDAWRDRVCSNTQRLQRKGVYSEGWTVEQYCAWLRKEDLYLTSKHSARKNEDTGQLEIELFAHTFNIQVDVFVKGQELINKTGQFLSPFSYGPKSKDKIYLLNTLETPAFYALAPKIKGEAVHHQTYWAKNSNLLFNSGWKHFAV